MLNLQHHLQRRWSSMQLKNIEPNEHGCFEEQMVFHMQQQTKFLGAIYDTMKAVQTIMRAIKWVIGTVLGGFGLWELLKANFKL